MRRSLALLALVTACEGPAGPRGQKGDPGAAAPVPDAAVAPVVAPCASGCDTAGLSVEIKVSTPANGTFFTSGEQPILTIRLRNGQGQLLAPSALATANLYVAGPRAGAATRTAAHLMNAVTDRSAPDRQHHTVYLGAPRYADATQKNLTALQDGTLRYTLAAVADEAAGTYTAGVWAKSGDEIDQVFAVADLQIKTATVETYAADPAACGACHTGAQSGKTYMAHILPGFSPFGNYALDSAPIADCKVCHNNDGYSANPLVRKVHGAHRGAHMQAPGMAHPDYGLGADRTLAEFTNVEFPSFPDGEKDCASCHADDRWKTAPSRLACGTCHDNVFFDSGTLSPARVLAGAACTQDLDCSGRLASCNVATGRCERHTHPVQIDDAQCASCHTADSSGLAPIAAVHEVTQRTRTRGLTVAGLTLSGASGAGGAFQVGDTISITFALTDAKGSAIADLATNAALSGNVLVAGPTDAPQRVLGNPIPVKTQGTLNYDAAAKVYHYTLPAPIPAAALPGFNADPSTARATNPSGTYALWLYVNEALTVNGAQVRDAGNGLAHFALGAAAPLRPREVITRAACDSCHGVTQAHGGSRQMASACYTCHNDGALDRGVGAKGNTCTDDTQCPGAAAGWESCQAGTCTVTTDPTPDASIDFRRMVHAIHFARLRDGVTEFVGFRNTLVDLGEILLPQDVRNCTKCHADSAATCSAQNPCGVGQQCMGGTCKNVSWQAPSTAVCLSCHDGAAPSAHAASMTFQGVETCTVCHGPNADFAVSRVHDIAHPYQPPYPREKE